MSSSDSETEFKKKKEKKHKDKERKDREKEERKKRTDKEKERKDEDKEQKDKEKDKKKAKKDKLSHPSGVSVESTSPGTPSQSSHSQPAHPSKSEEVPWFLRDPDTEPTHDQLPRRSESNFPIQTPPPQYEPFHPLAQQQPFRAAGNAGGIPPVQNTPPSGYRIPLGPNVQFPAPDRLGQSPTTDFDGSTPVFVGSAIFPNSVHPCRVIPSLYPPCRVLYDGREIEHHGRYDLLPVTQDMEWVPSKDGQIPSGCRPVEGGYEPNGSKLYHALGFVQGIYVLGKAGQHLRGASIPFGGNEHNLQENYSILCWR